jgi:cytochrome c oxidase subunit 3
MARGSSFRTDELSTGGGGRGPHPPQPFGGGGGGGGRGGDGDSNPSHGERLRRYRMGLYFMIGSIMMLFISFTTLFVATRQAGHFDPFTGRTEWVSTPLPLKLLAINTLILALSSISIEIARRAAAMETILVPLGRIPGVAPIRESSIQWVRATAVIGFAFLAGQAMVWLRLHELAETIGNPLSSSFVVILTGGHAVHLFGGLMVLLYVSLSRRLREKYESRRIAIDVTAWYWHFMGAVWLYVLGVVAFIH